MTGFEEVEHTADKALRIVGINLKELMISAAQGMTQLMVGDVSKISNKIKKSIELQAVDAESLLVEWLGELAYWAETEMLVFKKFKVTDITATRLQATIWGATVPELEKHIKAVTYHNLEIRQTPKGLEATVVFDV
jgi:SHS2 domain-containing protein